MVQEQRVAEPVTAAPVRRIVVPVSGTDREFLAQEHAVLFADALGVPLTAVKVSLAPDEESPDTFMFLEKLADRRGVPFEGIILAGTDAVEVILSELDPLDLTIIGSERIGDRHHVGGFAERLLHDAPGAVQVVRLGRVD